MKTITAYIIILIFSFSLSAQERDVLDSIIYSNKGFVEAKIYRNPGNAFALSFNNISKEIRFYDEHGFFCLAVYLDKNDSLVREKSGALLKYYNKMDYFKDPVFLSDTFAQGFVNKLKSYRNMSIQDSFEKTISFYYSQRDYRQVDHIKNFLDRYDKKVTIALDSAIDIIEEFVPIQHCGGPSICAHEYIAFREMLFTGVDIPQKELERIGHQVIIEFETDIVGGVHNIKLITKLAPKSEKKIIQNIEKMQNFSFTPGRARCRLTSIKGALYFNPD
jgi:hypothetical protein